MILGVVITFVAAVVVGWMMYADSGPPDEERYCLKCAKVTRWHPKKGCEHCAWMDRQW